MDNIQASILNYRLLNLKKHYKKRRNNVNLYLKHLNFKNLYFKKTLKMNLILIILL